MRSDRRAPAVLMAAVLCLGAAGFGSEEKPDRPPDRGSRFSLEIGAGIGLVDPEDFNLLASFEEAYVRYAYIQRYTAARNANWTTYAVMFERRGDAEFGALRAALPARVRIVYDLARGLSVSLGVQYLAGRRATSTQLAAGISDLRPDQTDYPLPLSYEYRNPEFVLAASAWTFQAGLHFRAALGPRLSGEGIFAGGLLMARCRHISEAHYYSGTKAEYFSERTERLEMSGSGSGASFELGGRLLYEAAPKLDLFVEAGYALRVCRNVSGPGAAVSQSRDSHYARDPILVSWGGPWNAVALTYRNSWGSLAAQTSGNKYGEGAGFHPFTLDLSGFQIQAGLILRLGNRAAKS